MTTVTFFESKDFGLIGFEAKGHSDYADEGEDIVCAAVSALTQSSLNGIVNVVKAPVRHKIDEENTLVTVCLENGCGVEPLRDSQILLITLYEAIKGIAFTYPDHVRIKHKERREFTCSS